MSRQQIIRRIIDREREKLSLQEEVIQEEESELYHTACNLFGAWQTALLYAGVNWRSLRKQRIPSRRQLLKKIKWLCWRGYKLTASNAQRHHSQLHRIACRYFGNWPKALQAAGIHLPLSGLTGRRHREWSKVEILEEIRRWRAAGHSLRWHDISLKNRELAIAAKTAFISWRKALIAAGLRSLGRPRMPSRKWTPALVLEIIHQRQQEGKSLRCTLLRIEDPGLLTAAQRHWGGWRAALRAAGVNMKNANESAGQKDTTEETNPTPIP